MALEFREDQMISDRPSIAGVGMHSGYRDLVLARVKAVVESARAASAVQHRGLKGQIREILIRDLLRPLLPSDIGVGSGEIINHEGATSSQQDIVMYDKSILPPIVLEENYGLIPIESVLYTIEVKTRIDRRDIEDTHRNLGELLSYQVWPKYCDGCRANYRSLIPTVFSFEFGDRVSKSDIVTLYDEVRGDGPSRIGAFCLVGSGYWFWNANEGRWMTHGSSYPYEEVITFLAGVMNTRRMISNSRHDFRLGFYVSDEKMSPHIPVA